MKPMSTLLRALTLALSAILGLSTAATLPISAAETATVYVDDNFEKYNVTNGNVPDNYTSASYAGSKNYAIVKEGALSGNRSALVNDYVDWRWWGLNITTPTLIMEYKIRVLPTESMEFTACITLSSDPATGNEGLGGALTVIKGDGTDLGIYDRNGVRITALAYETDYTVKMTIPARSDTFTLEVGGETYENLPFSSKVYTVTALRLNASSGSGFYFDDFKVYSTSQAYPQRYSAQAPGAMQKLDYPTYYEPTGITLWLNRDGTEAGKGARRLDVPVLEANNTLYVPYESVKETILTGTENIPDKAPETMTRDGVAYVAIQEIAACTGGTVWWDEAEQMVVFTDGARQSDGILRNINGRFYMNGQPYYEISFNKFDIAAQILINYFPDKFTDFNNGEDQRANAERALTELRDNGFTSIRFFSYVNSYDMIHDPVESEKFWKAMDELYDLFDKYEIRVVPSLCLGSTYMTACEYVEGLGYISTGETGVDLIANPDSASRAFQKEYIEAYVNRYKDRDTVLMWEINNELNLNMDVGATTGTLTYSAYQLSEFYAWCTGIINACDPDRLVTSGDSVQRGSNYHLLSSVMAGQNTNDWTTDTYGQRLYMNYLIHGLGGMDVTSVHAYGESLSRLNIGDNRLNTSASRMSVSIMRDEARALGQPLYVGEAGTGTAHANVDYASIRETLNGYVQLGIQLVHWWSYDSCRHPVFTEDNDWTMNMTDYAQSVELLKTANRELKAKWLVNRADEPVTDPDGTTSETESETATAPDTATETTADTTETAPVNGGCVSSLALLRVMPVLLAGGALVYRKRRDDKSSLCLRR